MGEAIVYALDLMEQRKETYKNNGVQYYRPWVFLITDGAPTDSWQNAARRIREMEAQRRMLFFAVGVAGADMNKLRQIALPERPPVMLNGLDFTSALKDIKVVVQPGQPEFVCASTDGLERLAIRLSDWTPFNPFFQPLEQYLQETENPKESDEYLMSFLNSERLNARIDDDKTLFLCLYDSSPNPPQ